MPSIYNTICETPAASHVSFWFNHFWRSAGSQLKKDYAEQECRFRSNPIPLFSESHSLRVESEKMVRKTTAVLVVLLFALSASATTACELFCMNFSSKEHHGAGTNGAGHHHGQVLESHHHSHRVLPAGNTNPMTHSTTIIISNNGLKTCCCQADVTYNQCPSAVLRSAKLQKSLNKTLIDGCRATRGTIAASSLSASPPPINSANLCPPISNHLPLRI